MNNRELLVEQVEHARFALLMDDFAEEAGEALQKINAGLCDSQPDMVPESVLQRCLTLIQKAFVRKKRSDRKTSLIKLLKLLPLAVIIAASLLLLASAAFPAFRAGMYNVFRTDRREATEWTIAPEPDASQPIEADAPFTAELPPDFEMVYLYQSMMYSYADYQNSNDPSQTIHVEIVYSESASVSIDNERQTREYQLDVNGNDATLRANDIEGTIIWADLSVPCIVLIEADQVEDETLIRFARSLEYDVPDKVHPEA